MSSKDPGRTCSRPIDVLAVGHTQSCWRGPSPAPLLHGSLCELGGADKPKDTPEVAPTRAAAMAVV